ncbi:MAG: hypothetical protein GKR89_30730 [Candidatus Latescibacteria bacterium]|nr:hypothetical protein [Candidatus Latescibacterota bacterium]
MSKTIASSCGYDRRMVKSNIRLMAWIFVWTATMVLVDKAELYQWHSSFALTIGGIIANTAIGVGMIFTFIRYLKEQDEMQRKIQLDALAITMGVTLVGSYTYSLLVTAKLIIDAEVSDLIMLMALSYTVANIVGQLRYR